MINSLTKNNTHKTMPGNVSCYRGIISHQGEWLVLIQKNPHLFLRLSESLSMSLSSPILCLAPASGLAKVSCLPSVPRPRYYSAVQGHYEPLAAYCRCHANNEYLFLSSTCLAVCLSVPTARYTVAWPRLFAVNALHCLGHSWDGSAPPRRVHRR